MDREHRLKRLRFRAWHRGTREADFMIGGFFDRYSESWNDAEIGWFEALMNEQDVDIMAWAIGSAPVPQAWRGEMMDRMQRLDFIPIAK
jgi:antitoxin CptB